MRVWKTIVQQADDGMLLACDTIEHEGKFWLVPEWLAGPIPGTERPARLVGLRAGLPLGNAGPDYPADFLLSIPLSRDTLAGGTAQGFDVIIEPDIIQTGADTDYH